MLALLEFYRRIETAGLASRRIAPARRRLIYASKHGWILFAENWNRGGSRKRSTGKILALGMANLLMLDFDKSTVSICLAALEAVSERAPNRFSIYQTANGFHAFGISRPHRARSYTALALAAAVKSDPRYAWMAALKNRFDVRISPKSACRDLQAVHIKRVGTGPEDPHLRATLACHDSILQWSAARLPQAWSLEDDELWADAHEWCKEWDRRSFQ